MSEDELVVVQVRTRHPENYVLINTADETRWRIVGGVWSQVYLTKTGRELSDGDIEELAVEAECQDPYGYTLIRKPKPEEFAPGGDT